MLTLKKNFERKEGTTHDINRNVNNFLKLCTEAAKTFRPSH